LQMIGINKTGVLMEAQSYTVAQMMSDIMAVIKDAAIYIIPAAILVAVVAFVLAWFMDSIDFAGKSFGRHR